MEFQKRKLDGRPFDIIGQHRIFDRANDQDADLTTLSENISGLSTQQCSSCQICDPDTIHLLLPRLSWVPESLLAPAEEDHSMRPIALAIERVGRDEYPRMQSLDKDTGRASRWSRDLMAYRVQH
jgi:hypothetical protein